MIGAIVGAIGSLAKGWFETKKAQQETKKASAEQRTRLAQSKEDHNAEWQMAVIENSDRWVKRISFIMFTLPFLVAAISPESVRNYFTIAIQSMPPWYIKIYGSITGTIWGISALKPTIQGIVGAFKKENSKK